MGVKEKAIAYDMTSGSPSIFYSRRDPNLATTARSTFLPQSSPQKSASSQAAAESIRAVSEDEALNPIYEAEASGSGLEEAEEPGVTVFDGIEDISDTQWAEEDERKRSSSFGKRSSPRRELSEEHISSSPSLPCSSNRRRPHSQDSSSPPDNTHLRTPHANVGSEDAPIAWTPSPSPPSRTKHRQLSPDTEEEDESFKPSKKTSDTVVTEGSKKASLTDLFSDEEQGLDADQDMSIPTPSFAVVGNQIDSDYDDEFDDNAFDDFDPDLHLAAGSSSLPMQPSAPLSAHRPDIHPNPLPYSSAFDSPSKVDIEYPIMLISDLPPDVQDFYLNHWRRGADKKGKKTDKRLLEVDSGEEEQPPAKKKAPSRYGPAFRGRGGRGRGRSWGRGRAKTTRQGRK